MIAAKILLSILGCVFIISGRLNRLKEEDKKLRQFIRRIDRVLNNIKKGHKI